MRALKYFPASFLVSIEDVMFDNPAIGKKKFTYALINDATNVYYIGASVSVADVIARLRLIVRGADYALLANQVQISAETSQMSSWVMACFEDHVTEDDVTRILRDTHRFEPMFKEKPYGANALDTTLVYTASHVHNGMIMTYASVNPNPTAAYQYIKRNLEALAREYRAVDDTSIADKLERVAAHTYSGEWVIIGQCAPVEYTRAAIRNQVMTECRATARIWHRLHNQGMVL